MLSFRDLIQISRPRFWLYTTGPVLVVYAAIGVFDRSSWSSVSRLDLSLLGGLFLFFLLYTLFPINLFIYGVNDLADGDTDKLNKKKTGYEFLLPYQLAGQLKKIMLYWMILPWVLAFVVIFLLSVTIVVEGFFDVSLLGYYSLNPLRVTFSFFFSEGKYLARIAFGLFLFTSFFYSLPPIRAKKRPFLDGLFNVLYILPALFVYLLFAPVESLIWSSVVAGWLRCMAMHAYSALPDIVPDREAGLLTTAVYLGEKKTLLYCAVLRMGAGILVSGIFPLFAIIATSVYVFLVSLSFRYPVFVLYKLFPWINACIGFWLFWLVVLS